MVHKHKCPVCDVEYNELDDIRSLPHLRRYMALCRAAHFHWPEAHPFQTRDWQALRAYLQMKCHYRELASRTKIVGMTKEQAIFSATIALQGAGSYAIPTWFEDELLIWKPKSISYAKLKHYDAVKLFEDVAGVIHAETGMSPEELLSSMDGP